MAPRTGRPRTGVTPMFGVRVNPEAVSWARETAKAASIPIGKWVEAALREKVARERVSSYQEEAENQGESDNN